MGEFKRIGDIVGSSTGDLYRQIRELQYQTRTSEVMEMRARRAERGSTSSNYPGEDAIPDDVLDEMDKFFVHDACEVRHGILKCDTQPYGSSFCDGSAHMRRAFSELYHKWIWRFYEPCPIARAEREILGREKAEGTTRPTAPTRTWRKA